MAAARTGRADRNSALTGAAALDGRRDYATAGANLHTMKSAADNSILNPQAWIID